MDGFRFWGLWNGEDWRTWRLNPAQPLAGVVQLSVLFGKAETQQIFAASGAEEC
jgi:hypothetical protein